MNAPDLLRRDVAPDERKQLSASQGPSAPAEADARERVAHRRTHIRPRRGWRALDLAELWRARDLLWIFTLRDIKVRYKQTFLGFTWALVVPIVQVLVFSVFFGRVLGVGERVNEAAGRALPYPLFALTGQVVWNFFKMTVDGSSMSLLSNADLLRKIYVPRLVLPLASVGKPAMDTAVAFLLMIGLAVWYDASGSVNARLSAPNLLVALLFVVGSAVPALALGLIVAGVTVTYRDLQHVLPLFTSLLFFATPVIYSVEVLPERYAWLIYLNPVAGFVQATRAAVLGLPFDWLGIAISLAFSLVLFVFGLFYFTRAERRFADVA
jgi:lipopolysaccharide transport system permease protein